ncbi:MAG: DUF3641 domain-containing protein, partial [Deltaproteobacteria bacterium]
MKIFGNELPLRKVKLDVIQINLGNKCNLQCSHCHIGASPEGNKNMDHKTAERIIGKLKNIDIQAVEFTGG